MDVDTIEDEPYMLPSYAPKAPSKRPLRLAVDEAHPFELEAYIGSYSGQCSSAIAAGRS